MFDFRFLDFVKIEFKNVAVRAIKIYITQKSTYFYFINYRHMTYIRKYSTFSYHTCVLCFFFVISEYKFKKFGIKRMIRSSQGPMATSTQSSTRTAMMGHFGLDGFLASIFFSIMVLNNIQQF